MENIAEDDMVKVGIHILSGKYVRSVCQEMKWRPHDVTKASTWIRMTCLGAFGQVGIPGIGGDCSAAAVFKYIRQQDLGDVGLNIREYDVFQFTNSQFFGP